MPIFVALRGGPDMDGPGQPGRPRRPRRAAAHTDTYCQPARRANHSPHEHAERGSSVNQRAIANDGPAL